MSMSETTPPNSVGRLFSLAAIREPTVAVEINVMWAQHLDRRLAATRNCHARALIVVLKSGLTAQAGNNSTCARLEWRDFTEKSR